MQRYNLVYTNYHTQEKIIFDSLQKAITYAIKYEHLENSKKNRARIRHYILDTLKWEKSYFIGGSWNITVVVE